MQKTAEAFIGYLTNILSSKGHLIIFIVGIIAFITNTYFRFCLVDMKIPDIGGMETSIIYSLQRQLADLVLYSNIEQAPFSPLYFTPLYFYIVGFFGELFSVNPNEPQEVYALSRSASLLFNLLHVLICFVIANNVLRIKPILSFIIAIFIFMFLDRTLYSRVDALYVVFSMATILVYLKFLKENKLKYLILASVFVVFAVFSKQSGIYLLLIVVAFNLIFIEEKRYTRYLIFSICFTFLLFLLLFIKDINVFFQNVVLTLNNPIKLSWFYKNIVVEFIYPYSALIGLTLGVALFYLKNADKVKVFFGVSILGSFTFALFSSLKYGSSPNYFIDFFSLSFILVFYLLDERNKLLFSENIQLKQITLLFVVCFVLMLKTTNLFWGGLSRNNLSGWRSYDALYEENKKIYAFLHDKLNDDTQLFCTTQMSDFLACFFYKNCIMQDKASLSSYFSKKEVFNWDNYRKGVKKGAVKYLVRHKDKSSNSQISFNDENVVFLNAEFKNYKPIKEFDDYIIYIHETNEAN